MRGMRTFLTGASGRLGKVVEKYLLARGDNLVQTPDSVNYLVFAHRYRGEENFTEEMNANVGMVYSTIKRATWATGDCAAVIVSSVSATDPAMNQSFGYSASKSAQLQLARYFAKDALGARVNTVSPNTFTGYSTVVTPHEVANVILFLCSPLSSGISGQDIRVSR